MALQPSRVRPRAAKNKAKRTKTEGNNLSNSRLARAEGPLNLQNRAYNASTLGKSLEEEAEGLLCAHKDKESEAIVVGNLGGESQ